MLERAKSALKRMSDFIFDEGARRSSSITIHDTSVENSLIDQGKVGRVYEYNHEGSTGTHSRWDTYGPIKPRAPIKSGQNKDNMQGKVTKSSHSERSEAVTRETGTDMKGRGTDRYSRCTSHKGTAGNKEHTAERESSRSRFFVQRNESCRSAGYLARKMAGPSEVDQLRGDTKHQAVADGSSRSGKRFLTREKIMVDTFLANGTLPGWTRKKGESSTCTFDIGIQCSGIEEDLGENRDKRKERTRKYEEANFEEVVNQKRKRTGGNETSSMGAPEEIIDLTGNEPKMFKKNDAVVKSAREIQAERQTQAAAVRKKRKTTLETPDVLEWNSLKLQPVVVIGAKDNVQTSCHGFRPNEPENSGERKTKTSKHEVKEKKMPNNREGEQKKAAIASKPRAEEAIRLKLPIRGLKGKKDFFVKPSQLVSLVQRPKHPLNRWSSIITVENLQALPPSSRNEMVKILTDFVEVRFTAKKK